MNRRNFIQATAAGAMASAASPAATSKMIGIQVGAVSFVDEGVDSGPILLQEAFACLLIFLKVRRKHPSLITLAIARSPV